MSTFHEPTENRRTAHTLLLVLLIAASPVLLNATSNAVDQWKAPDIPKDDQHWYPEFPGPAEPLAALLNGDFELTAETEIGQPTAPLGWAHPDGLTCFWKMEAGHGKVIVLDTDVNEDEAKKRQALLRECKEKGVPVPEAPPKKPVPQSGQYSAIGATYGVSFYSYKFKLKPQATYKISFDYKGAGGGAKLWLRAWGPINGETHKRWERIINCHPQPGALDGWSHIEQTCSPGRIPLGKDKFKDLDISFYRVMLYAYWPRGTYEFDNLKIEEVPAPAPEKAEK